MNLLCTLLRLFLGLLFIGLAVFTKSVFLNILFIAIGWNLILEWGVDLED